MIAVAKLISGGQTGADQGALAAARAMGVATGGTAPRGFKTALGDAPDLLRGYGLVEHRSASYPARTEANVADSDATLIIARTLDRGSALTAAICTRLKRPCRVVAETEDAAAEDIAHWITDIAAALGRPLVLNVAGCRESREPGIAARTEDFVARVLTLLDP